MYNDVVSPNVNSAASNYKTFQEQELNKSLGYNMIEFKYRHYDYAIGRFVTTDPLSDSYQYNSPYAFQENKLGLGVELEGLELGPSKHNPLGLAPGMINRNVQNAKKHLDNGDTPAMAYAKGMLETGGEVITTTAAVASVFVPGPEDVVMAYAAGTRYGASALKLLSKAGDKLGSWAKGLFKSSKASKAADSFSSSLDEVTEAFTSSKGAGKLDDLKIDDIDDDVFQISGNFDGTDIAFQGKMSVKDGVLTIDGGDFEGAIGVGGFREALASFGKSANVQKVVFNSGKRGSGAKPGKQFTVPVEVKDYFE